MERAKRTVKIIVLDTLGVALIIIAIAFGWLPGPGGLPLFIVGLGLLAVHHEWARRYMTIIKKYSNRLGEIIFVEKPLFYFLFDLLALGLMLLGLFILWQQSTLLQIGLGTMFGLFGLLIGLRNRHRYRFFSLKRT